jgi:hypothetical protein
VPASPANSPEARAALLEENADMTEQLEATAELEAEAETLILDVLEPQVAQSALANTGLRTALDYNLANLDASGHHVELSGNLHQQFVVTERRTSIVDSLMAAIKRDPSRGDLRMKLIETLYSAASSNQRAFRDVVSNLVRQRDIVSAEDWQRIERMGREIIPDDPMFAEPDAAEDLKDCA